MCIFPVFLRYYLSTMSIYIEISKVMVIAELLLE